MKRLHALFLAGTLFCGPGHHTAYAQEVMDSMPQVILGLDSASGIMPLSDDGYGKINLLNGIIPPAPQSRALARYAEYPVSHTTGIPDISIPLYEIQVGNYTLPISVSYHSSGARVDDVPTCVGQGWTLNAGGAVIRTVMGAPDWPGSSQEKKYMDVKEVKKLIKEKKGDGPYGYRHILRMLLENNKFYDTESDRYSYNVGGLTGLFRYDINKDDFVTLDHAQHIISHRSNDEGTKFIIKDAVGNEYRLGKNEVSCLSDDGNGNEYTTAWYVDSIMTPYGNIRFKYLPGSLSFNISRTSTSIEAGYCPYKNGEEGVLDNFNYAIQEFKGTAPYKHDQTLVREITWEGNRIVFEYSNDNPGFGPHRLDSMTVYNSDGDERKKVTFSYKVWHESGSDKTGRHMLTAIDDSETGRFSFAYYDTDGYAIPSWTRTTDTAGFSDLWGYYNGGNATKDFLPPGVAEQLEDYWHKVNARSRDRNPNFYCTRMGTLKTVQYPTGGSVTYSYELNSVTLGGKQYNAGGLRVSRVDVRDGGTVYSKTYSYQGHLTQDPPEQRMICDMTLVWQGVEPFPSTSYATSWRTASSYPIGYSYAPSNPVAYTFVKETNSDGSRTEYEYFLSDLVDDAVSWPTPHPSTWSPSLTDPGRRQPKLKRRSVFNSSGNEVFRESLEYARVVDDYMFTTGVRIYSNITWCDYSDKVHFYTQNEKIDTGEWEPVAGVFIQPDVDDYLFYDETKAERTPFVPSKRTEENLLTGFRKVTEYSYDEDYRTLQPRFCTITNSDGTVFRTEYTYPFNHDNGCFQEMAEYGLNDLPVETRTYSGKSLLSRERIEYTLHNGCFYPSSISSWSAPTASSLKVPPPTLPEREHVSGFNAKGRPLSVKVNDTDLSSFSWNATGTLLISSTAPGGLVTKYTHKPLFGLASVTLPNGYKTQYTYNAAGMLRAVSDHMGTTEEYAYSISSHPTMHSDGNSVTALRWLDSSGQRKVTRRQYYSGTGLETTLLEGGLNTSGRYVYTSVGYDALRRPSDRILPGVGGTSAVFKSHSEVLSMAQAFHGEDYVRSNISYDALDRQRKVFTSGDLWHSGGKAKETQYISNAANSVRLYSAPMDRISLVEDGYYVAGALQGVRTIDEDGNEMTVYTDRLGRKVLERRGPESEKGMNDTYFVYNALGQLRYVLTPGYELSGYKDKFAYEYRYDENGNVVKKFIPGAGYTQYWYDRAGRLAFMQDPNLREKGLHRFYVYDRAGRLAVQGVSKSSNRSGAVNFADYSGGNGGFMSTGYTLEDASRIQQATLETVNYYDAYAFAGALDSGLVKDWTVSAKGMLTGSAVYCSDGTKSLSALYYDLRGNVVESRERTPFGALRTTANTYSYTGQLLKSTVKESPDLLLGSVTIVTENTYDTGSGLLTATDVTVNGTKQRVSAIKYDDLGRIASVTRGAELNSGGKVEYSYNLHGQTTKIAGPGLTQELFYADGPGKSLYNGSVSAMKWKMGTDTRVRGYKYTYNGYGWLTSAEYGEDSDLASCKSRYSERCLDFMRNGGIRRLQRHGLKADGVYGKVDNLHIYYDGNRITGVLEDADPVTQNGSMDYPGVNAEMAFQYNEWGALTKDESRGITDITYDNSGNPVRISFADGGSISNVYSSAGERIKTVTRVIPTLEANPLDTLFRPWNPLAVQIPDPVSPPIVLGQTAVEYHGQVIYRNGTVDMVLFPGGYATLSGSRVTFHYYTQDYLGNNRAVINGSNGAIEQTVAYYPFGGIIADLGTKPTSGQPYKFGGKELLTANGLNEYDFGARRYFQAVPHFTSVDPLCEKRPDLSPYLYCGNNPVNAIDLDGRETYLWTTILPGPIGKVYKSATHSFITVTTENKGKKITSYYAFGSKNDGPFNWMSGQLVKCSYKQDLGLIKGEISEEGIVKDKFLITPPEGMTQDEFDNKVKEVASSFGNQEKISYFIDPSYPLDGNCNSSTYTILKKAGISEEILKDLDNKIQGIHWGWGQLKPWTKEEQTKAIDAYPIFDFENKQYEILQNTLP